MTETSRFWDGVIIGDAATAPYSSDEFGRVIRELLRASKADDGPLLGSGISPDPGLTVSATSPASASVNVSAGSALVRGTWYANDATVNLAIAANASGNPRIDTIILRKNYAAQTIRLVVLQGTPAGSPVPASLTQVDAVTWEIPLADIAVANGFATITAANIVPRRNWANAADGVYLLDVLNNSGGALETGDVVVWDTTADRAVTTTTIWGDPNTAGVWVGRTGAGGYGRVLTQGIGYVKTVGATARGYLLVSSTTAKKADSTLVEAGGNSARHALGMSLVTSSAELRLAYINVGGWSNGAAIATIDTNSVTSISLTFVNTHANHIAQIVPNGSRVKVTFTFPGAVQNAAKVGYFDIYSDGLAARAGDPTYGLMAISGVAAPIYLPISIVALFTGLAPGVNQTFRLQYKTNDASSYVAVSGTPVYILAEEV